MSDYFSEYTSFIGGKGLPSPADTPYETPGFLKTRRSSRATTAGSRSREPSSSPPPLPPDAVDYNEKSRDGRYSALDPRRFTPTLHASFVSEILSLRRELESKNNLVDNLENELATTKNDNEGLSQQLTASTKAGRLAKQQVHQMEAGTLEALDAMARERDAAKITSQDLRSKLEAAQNNTRLQDQDAERTQSIWEREKETWDNERRQLERRVHVTETRLRTFVEEMTARQAANESQNGFHDEAGESNTFNDSGIGLDSELGAASPKKQYHVRNASSMSYRSRNGGRASGRRSIETPEPWTMGNGHSLADELGIDEEDEYDMDEFEHGDESLEYPERVRRNVESRQEDGDPENKAKRVLGLTDEIAQPSHRRDNSAGFIMAPVQPPPEVPREAASVGVSKVTYVDTGYQPSPPPSPPKVRITPAAGVNSVPIDNDQSQTQHAMAVAARVAASPISPPETPIIDSMPWSDRKRRSLFKAVYSDVATQTEVADTVQPKAETNKRDSLRIPVLVPSIAIHPPSSRPSSPRPYALPPGTRNASTQASLAGNGKDASVQTEEIRIDKRRQIKLPPHLLPSYLDETLVYPEPPAQFDVAPTQMKQREVSLPPPPILTNFKAAVTAMPTPPVQSPVDATSPVYTRHGSNKSLSSMPLKAIPLPKPVLAPSAAFAEAPSTKSEGPLNRSSQFGVSQNNATSRQLAAMDVDSDYSDYEDAEMGDVATSMPRNNKAPVARFDFPASIFGNMPQSPMHRPGTADSYDAAPAPSIASSAAGSFRGPPNRRAPPPPKLNSYNKHRSRSPSFNSIASSSFSTQSAIPPYPIPMRSSSRVMPPVFNNGRRSPTPDNNIVRGHRNMRGAHQKLAAHQRQGSLRKVQSATAMRGGHGSRMSPKKSSPQKPRRRLRSPSLTPVQSMAFESPASPRQTKFPIPELPTPLQQTLTFDWGNCPSTSSKPPGTAGSSLPPSDETQLIDAIAATMVGEWMWKYIRKRKSFGVEAAADDFAAQAGDNQGIPSGSHGTRHKRWVWLSPYERTIMWGSKQPTSGQALLGKKGRKLTIQAVLDVKDETPLGRKPELTSAFERSILILTPARALKFTAVDAKRHALWMSALTFLAEADRNQTELLPLPLIPPMPNPADRPKRDASPSMGRAAIRDSVMISKSKHPSLLRTTSAQQNSSFPPSLASPPPVPDQGADFPSIPRLYSSTTRHQRKRSNTAPRLAPPFATNFRSFSSSAVPSTAMSNTSSRPGGNNSLPSSKPSAESSRPSVVDTTVRMEAFVDPALRNGVLYVPPPPAAGEMAAAGLAGGKGGSMSPRRRRQESNVSNTTVDRKRAGYIFDEEGLDPFKGF
ncbi:hypothetical protein LTR95_012421 [Oleoguttula sp. CCFEE 5521]